MELMSFRLKTKSGKVPQGEIAAKLWFCHHSKKKARSATRNARTM